MDKTVVSFRYLTILLFLGYLVFWVYLLLSGIEEGFLVDNWTDSYGIIAAVAGASGLFVAKLWGGYKSYLGRAITLLSWGLVFQFFGQFAYAVHARAFKVENPYPSFGDVFYFGTFALYAWGMFLMSKALAIGIGLNKSQKMGIWMIPLVFVLVTWSVFFNYSGFKGETLFVNILDLAYPLAESVYIALTVMAVIYSARSLGGKLKPYVLSIFMSMVVNFFANAYFMYEDVQGLWRPSGWSDLFYLIAYFMLGLSLLGFYDAQKKLKK